MLSGPEDHQPLATAKYPNLIRNSISLIGTALVLACAVNIGFLILINLAKPMQ